MSITKCANCGLRPGTIRWGDMLAVTHGFVVMWCEICVVQKQIEHAEEQSIRLPDLYERLAALDTGELGSPPK